MKPLSWSFLVQSTQTINFFIKPANILYEGLSNFQTTKNRSTDVNSATDQTETMWDAHK